MSDRIERCPACGKPTSPDAETCRACDEPLRKLCGCGATVSVFASACPSCGAALRTARPRRRRRRRQFLLALVALAVLAGGVFAIRKVVAVRGARLGESAEIAAREIRRGDYSSARVRLRTAIRKEGETNRALWLLAVAEHGLGHRDEAERLVRRVLENDAGDEEAALLLEGILLDTGRPGEALDRARAAVAAGSKRAGHHETIARALLVTGEGEPEEVEREFRTAAALAPEPGPAALRLGEWTLATAEAMPDRPLDADERAAIRTARGILARDLGPEADLDLYRRVARMDLATRDASDFDRLLEPVSAKRADPAYRLLLARLAARGGRPRDARRLVEGLLREERTGAEVLLGLRALLIDRGDAARAETLLARTREEFPDDPAVAVASADAALAAGDEAEAERTMRAALAREPENVDLAVSLAGLLAASNRKEEAEDLLRRAAESPAGTLARLRLAGMLLDGAATAGEEAVAEAAVLVDSARTGARREPLLARLLRRQEGRLALARGDATAAVERLAALVPAAPADAGLHVLLARARRLLGEPAVAAAELTAAIRIGGPAVPTLLARADAWLAAGRPAAAERDARTALDAEPENLAGGLLLARAQAAGDRPLDALATLDRLPEGTPEAEAIRGQALLRAGRPEDARDRLAAALRGVDSPEDRFDAGLLLAKAEDETAKTSGSERRRAFLTTFVAEHPGHSRARAALVRLLSRDGDLAAARAAAEEAVAAAPGNGEVLELALEVNLLANGTTPADVDVADAVAKALAAAVPGSWRSPYAAGRVALARGQDDDAVAALRRAAELAPATAKVLAWLGLALHRAGTNAEAAAALGRALEIEPDFPFPNRLLARVMLGLAAAELDAADPEAALGLLAGAARHDADEAGLLAGIRQAARLAARRGDRALLERAREECRKLLAETAEGETETRARIWRVTGDLSAGLGDAGGALAAARQHATLAPDDPLARARLAVALDRAGQTEDALAALDAAGQELAAAPAILAARSSILAGAGRTEEAAAAAGRWAEVAPESAGAHLAHGTALESLGRAEAAEAEYRRALAIAPGLVPAARRLAARLAATGRVAEAAALLDDLAAKAEPPARAVLRFLGAELRRETGPDAEARFVEIAEDESAPTGLRLAAERRRLEILLAAGRAAEAAERAGPILALVRRDAACAPGAPLAERAAAALVAAGLAMQKSGSPSFAAELYRETLARAPGDVTAANNLAELLAADARTAKEAASLAREVVAGAPDVPEFRDTLGRALAAGGDPVGAAEAYRAAAAAYRARMAGDGTSRTADADAVNLSRSLVGLARALLTVGDRDGARKALDEAAAANFSIREHSSYRSVEEKL